jgi:hypothetical protein
MSDAGSYIFTDPKQLPLNLHGWAQLHLGDCFASLAMTGPEVVSLIFDLHLNGYKK